MGLRFDPVGGGQFKQALAQIIEAEKQPVKQIEARKKLEEAKMKLFQDFKSKFTGFEKTLTEFSDFRKFRDLKIDMGDGGDVVGVTLDKEKAEPGTYTLTVDQLAARSSVISNGFKDPDKPVLGAGYVKVDSPDGDLEIFVDSTRSSLRGIAGLINADPKSPIQATVINDQKDSGEPWRLILSSKVEGPDHEAVFPEFYFMDTSEDFYFDDNRDAESAMLQLDGFDIEAPANTLKDFMTGVNLQLKSARPGKPVTITITEDYQKIAGKVKGLVDQVNGILDFINKQNQVDEKSDTRTMFTGDTSLQSIEYRLRNLLHEGFPVDDAKAKDGVRWKWLNQVGITFNKTGMLDFNEEKFTKALQDDFQGISQAITGEHGFAPQMKKVMANFTRPGNGMLANREASMKQRLRQMDDQIGQKERRIDQRVTALTNQFARLESTLSNLQRQQAYLGAIGGGGGGNMVSQLLGG